jgi:hypothetical protein
MSFFDCPYCEKKVDIIGGNPFWLFTTTKKCQLCFKPIRVNEVGLIAYYLFFPIIAVIISLALIVAIKLIIDINQYIQIVILLLSIFLILNKIEKLFNRTFGLKLFSPKSEIANN